MLPVPVWPPCPSVLSVLASKHSSAITAPQRKPDRILDVAAPNSTLTSSKYARALRAALARFTCTREPEPAMTVFAQYRTGSRRPHGTSGIQLGTPVVASYARAAGGDSRR